MKTDVTRAVGLWGLAATGLFAAATATGENPSVYAREAEAFLAARDNSIQPRQIAAIRKATRGETNDL